MDGRRVLVVNPNTSRQVTDAYLSAAGSIKPGLSMTGATGRFGAQIVSTPAENMIAAHAALECVAEYLPGHDGVILAISFDTGLGVLRELVPVPVVGITEAALLAASAQQRSFGAVFFGEISRGLYETVIADHGMAPVAMEAIDIASRADYLSPAARDAEVLGAVRRLAGKGAEAAVICGAAIVGMAARLQARAPVPLFDGLQAVPLLMDRMQAGPPPVPRKGRSIAPSVGLPASLADLIRGGDST